MTDPTSTQREETGLEIAVIGMAGRFPAADDVDELWQNLLAGVDGVSRLTEDELRGSGVTSGQMTREDYVRAKGVFPRLEYFDAAFFGYNPADATVLDPQVRALHEEVYHALEDAGYTGEGGGQSVGLFLGATNNMAWEYHSLRRFVLGSGVTFSGTQLNDKDFAATRIAHALGLTGPALTLHSACSTSLVAIDTACRHLWTGSCRIALAGGSGLTLPQKHGYTYEPHMIFSPDGTCRPFDHEASGTVEGNGVGVVALKRLADAVADGDRIHAVIKGSAVNNDGQRKVGYTAPSIEGQAEVIRRAHRMARVRPETISYVEAHGTGTALGDPIEVEALRKAFGPLPARSVGLGSLKSNLGHTDVAAGVSSFIKTCLVLEHGEVPASLHYEAPNANIDFENSPFHVVAENTPLRAEGVDRGDRPARAAVSAFGIGGTNAHLVLEQAPLPSGAPVVTRAYQTLVVSAASEAALTRTKQRLADHLSGNEALDPAAVAWTMQRRQRDLPHRYTTEFTDAVDLASNLRAGMAAGEASRPTGGKGAPSVHFLFSGLGAQHLRMARDLYLNEEVFRDALDLCFELSEAIGGTAERDTFLGDSEADAARMNRIAMAQSLLFMVEYSMAQLLLSWGIQPQGMIGHSTGELVAACVAGVFTLEEAIPLVAARGELMDQAGPGTLLSVKASHDVLTPLLHDDLAVAAVNSPEDCTLTGTCEAIEAAVAHCEQQGIEYARVEADHAYHSRFMEPILERFRAAVGKVRLREPRIPYVSNVTGTWITPEQATNPDYYVAHVRETVQFRKGIETMLESERPVFVEVGPGKTLSTHARSTARPTTVGCVNMLRHRKEEVGDSQHLARALGRLWELGVVPDWKAVHGGGAPQPVTLPLYPFDQTTYPIDVDEFRASLADASDLASLQVPAVPAPIGVTGHGATVVPQWAPSVLPELDERARVVLVLTDAADDLRDALTPIPRWRCLWVRLGDTYEFRGLQGATIRADESDDVRRLIADLAHESLIGDTFLVHVRDAARGRAVLSEVLAEVARTSEGAADVLLTCDGGATAQALVLGRSLEYPGLRIRALDLTDDLADPERAQVVGQRIRRELSESETCACGVRYRDGRRLVATFTPVAGIGATRLAEPLRRLVLCEAGAVVDVVDSLERRPSTGHVTVLALSLGEPGHGEPAASTQPGVQVRPTLVDDTVEGLLAQVTTALADARIDEIILWDPAPVDEAVGSAPANASDLRRRLAGVAAERGVPVGAVSAFVGGIAGWTADLTDWWAEHADADAATSVTRLYEGTVDAAVDAPAIDLVSRLREAGMQTAHRGDDLLAVLREAASVPPVEPDPTPQEQGGLAALIEAELSKLVGYPEIDHQADVFDLGLDSVRLVRLTNLLERHGYKVVASDVYNNPTIARLTRFIAESSRSRHEGGESHDSVAALLTDRLGRAVRLHRISAPEAAEVTVTVLFVEGLDEQVRSETVRLIESLALADEFVPHYILPLDREDAVVADGTWAALGLAELGPGELERMFAAVDRSQDEVRRLIASGAREGVYPINGTQQAHFEGETRLQLYLIRLRELLDADVLKRALRDVVSRHGLLRSVLARRDGTFEWHEFEPPMGFELPVLDLSALTPAAQTEVGAQLVQREWEADFKETDKLMYHAVLVKYNERSYDLFFQFDHSIFDVTSGQNLRGDLIKRYRALMRGERRALPPARTFRELQDQIDKGPVGITADEIIEKFELERWERAMDTIVAKAEPLRHRRVRGIRYSIDLDAINAIEGDEMESFSLIVQLYSRALGRLMEVDEVAFDIIFRSRGYEGRDYSEVMGMILGALPVVTAAQSEAPQQVGARIIEKFNLLDQHNISFLNLVHDEESEKLYGKVLAVGEERGADLRSTCLLNFVGNVENEYEEIWRMTLAQLEDEDQSKLDYADFYGISKINEGRLDLLVLTKWVDDPDAFVAILDEELERLTGRPAASSTVGSPAHAG